jgi:hypothetical protein
MEILLQKLPRLRGIYDGKVPTWACYLYPEAARSLLRIESETGGLVYTSVWRSANGSLWAIKNKSGAMPPGFSAHNYGLAVDITIDQVLKETAWSYETLYDYMEGFGWYCHRRDKKERFEKWHFNYLGIPPLHLDLASGNSRTWHLPVEQRIQDLYGMHFEMDTRGVQSVPSLSVQPRRRWFDGFGQEEAPEKSDGALRGSPAIPFHRTSLCS